MMPRTRELSVRKGGEVSRDRTMHRVSSAIDAQRRLNARHADGTPTRADPVRPDATRYANRPRSHD